MTGWGEAGGARKRIKRRRRRIGRVQEVATLTEPLIWQLQIYFILFYNFFRIPGRRSSSVSFPQEGQKKKKKKKIKLNKKRKKKTLDRDKEKRKFHQSGGIFLQLPKQTSGFIHKRIRRSYRSRLDTKREKKKFFPSLYRKGD